MFVESKVFLELTKQIYNSKQTELTGRGGPALKRGGAPLGGGGAPPGGGGRPRGGGGGIVPHGGAKRSI